MKINEVIKLSAFYLGLDESDNKIRTQLLKCANLVINEICADHYPLVREAAANTGSGTVNYTTLAPALSGERVLEVLSVRNGAVNVAFRSYPAHMKTAPGLNVTVRFSYVPGDYGENGDAPVPDKIGERITAYGAATEYCLINGLFEEAVIWEKRYRDSLAAVTRKRGEITVPARRWL